MLFFALFILTFKWLKKRNSSYLMSSSRKRGFNQANSKIRSNKKPPWVKKEVLRLCSFLPDHGCRKISAQFNRIYSSKGMTISKSYVYLLRKTHQYEINSIRRLYKNRVPKEIPINTTWGLDFTGKVIHSENREIMGVIDHGSRQLLALQHLRVKSTIQVLRIILQLIETYGVPKQIRTDNESVFASKLFSLSLALIGIKHQRTMINSPWQNGRIERLFLTLKEKMNQVTLDSISEYHKFLDVFKHWYNHTRPHQHLNGLTPYEFCRIKHRKKFIPKGAEFFYDYEGLFQGISIKY